MAFTETFGGTTIYPSDVSYRAISLSANQTLAWPLEVATNSDVVAQIMDVTPSAGSFTITMPPANEVSPGETALFFNAGSFNFTVADNAGNTIVAITPGLAYQIYLRTNTTVAGQWRTTQFGAGTSSATAGSLVGAGIKAINTTLNQSMAVSSLSVNYTAGASDRSSAFLWTGGAGTITLPAASTVGNDWFFHIRNGGTGAISLATTGGELINGTATVDFNPGDSSIIVCDGSGYFTIGFGQAPEFLFDYVSIDLTGQPSPYTLSGANLNRIAYQFSGTLTANMQIIVPATIQQYWVGNFTTGGSYTVTVKTSAGTGTIVATNARSILYCDGTNVVNADTGGISIPILVSQGGTGATNASDARTNLGATSIGNALFIAVNDAAARNAITAAKSGANSDITSLTGLTTPLSVPQGGTGAATFTANGLIYGSGASALGVTVAGTTGQVLVGNTGTAPSWSTLSGIGVTSFSAGSTGLTPSTATTGIVTLAGTLIAANGGTGFASYAVGDLLFASTTTVLSKLADVATGNALISGGIGVAPSYGKIGLTTHVSGTLDVGNGGTGATTLTANGVLYGSGTSAIAATAVGATGEVLVGNTGGAPSWAALTGIGVTSFSAGTTGLTPNSATTGAITLAGTLGVANGGTGTATAFTAGSVVFAGASGVYSQDNANLFWDDTNNRLGIGTATPAVKLDVVGAGVFKLDGSGSTTPLILRNNNTASTQLVKLGFDSNGAVKASINAAVYGNDYMTFNVGSDTERMRISSAGYVGIGTTSPAIKLQVSDVDQATARIGVQNVNGQNYQLVAGNPGASNTGFAIFDATASATRMYLDSSGNFGIGTASPSSFGGTLDFVVGTGSGSPAMTLYGGNATFSSLNFADGTVGNETYRGFLEYNHATDALNIGTAASERMRITSAGLVGIGTASPTAKLTVNDANGIPVRIGDISAAPVSQTAVYVGVSTSALSGGNGDLVLIPRTSDARSVLFYTGNGTAAERMRIDSAGLVGIGTATPNTKLAVEGSACEISINDTAGTIAGLRFRTSGSTKGVIQADSTSNLRFSSGTTEAMRINSSGNVGIGTSSPAYKLDVSGTFRTTGIAYLGDATTTLIASIGNSASSGVKIIQFQRASGTGDNVNIQGISTGVGAADLGIQAQGGNVGIGTSSPAAKLHLSDANAVFIQFTDVGNGASRVGQNGSGMTFGVDGGIGTTERMRITSAGLVGIGTSSPATKLDVNGAITSSGSINPYLALNNGTATSYVQVSSGALDVRVGGANPITFNTNSAERMRLDASGQLGIGCVPGYRLDVEAGDTTANIGYAMRLRSNATATAAAMQFTNNAVTNENGLISCTDAGALTIVAGGGSSSIRFRTNGAERASISSDGHFGMGTSARLGTNETLSVSAVSTFDGMWVKNLAAAAATSVVWNAAASGDNLFISFGTEALVTGRGSITYNRAGGLVAYNTTSDYRAKDILGPVTDAGATIDALKVYNGKMKGATSARPMLIAHEAQEVVPYAVTGEKDAVNEDGTDKHQQMDHQSFIPLLIAELQSLRARVAQLEGN
jgi:hypothetical protein